MSDSTSIPPLKHRPPGSWEFNGGVFAANGHFYGPVGDFEPDSQRAHSDHVSAAINEAQLSIFRSAGLL